MLSVSPNPVSQVPAAPPMPLSPPAQPFAAPIQPVQKSRRKKLIIGIVVAIIIIAALGGGAFALIRTLKQPTASQSATASVPAGWKKFTSKKFGISFATPKEWSVYEFDPQDLNTGANGITGDTISVDVPVKNASEDEYSFRVSKGVLGDMVKQVSASNSKVGYKTTTESLKWQGYDATETATDLKDGDGKPVTLRMLYVQIGDYVFIVPARDQVPNSVTEGAVTQAQYQQFVDSIRVDKSVVDAQAKQDNKPETLAQGKNVTLGAVTVPAGWKKVTAKYGISFATPSGWVEEEQSSSLSGGAVYFLTVESSSSADDRGYMTIGVYTSDLDSITNQSAYMAGAFGGGVSSTTEKITWNGYDARRVTMTANGQQQMALYVRVGNYTYALPDPDNSAQSNVESGTFDAATYKTFVNTIRVSKQS